MANSLLSGQTGLMDNSEDEEDDSSQAQEVSSAEPKPEPKPGSKTEPKKEAKEPAEPKEPKKAPAAKTAAASSKRRESRKIAEEEKVDMHTAQFPEFSGQETQPLPNNMELIKDVPLEVTVRLGKTIMKIRDILELGDGSIIELDKLAGEPVDLLVNGKLVAKGEVVVIDENFGFRVKDIISPTERLSTL